jgi:hypothetical protein
MTPPASRDRLNPKEIAAGAATAGRFHDVVVGASRAIHGQELRERDRESLKWAKTLLQSAGEGAVISMPSAKELCGSSNPVLVVRRAAAPSAGDDPDVRLQKLSGDITKVLRGGRSDELIHSLEALRTIFSMVSQMSLRSEVVARSSQTAGGSWLPSLTTLLS